MEQLSDYNFLDPAYRTLHFSSPGERTSSHCYGRRKTVVCRWCAKPAERTACPSLQWCRECRASYMMSARRYFCHVPHLWSPQPFFTFWQRAINTSATTSQDRAFTCYVCDRLGLDFELAMASVPAVTPAPIQLGELAVKHKLLAREERRWILNYQCSVAPHRRPLFGEIAILLGLWTEELLPALLAAQAERTRGIVPAIARQLNLRSQQLLDAERSFFGLYATRFGERAQWPATKLFAA